MSNASKEKVMNEFERPLDPPEDKEAVNREGQAAQSRLIAQDRYNEAVDELLKTGRCTPEMRCPCCPLQNNGCVTLNTENVMAWRRAKVQEMFPNG